ncbi:putative membrane-anchored protein [Dongia mobilis]|uniref:Putative membrane-anchored protein n=1 Tax=Dongia mobilis TaxID=578943 RepID=A0A4R6WTC7_9PROT|nr:DUF3422 domain-containing protein [Dongia mobilis]TDQ86390.1 putative membrane-anchored protein [Dongia mobilis]
MFTEHPVRRELNDEVHARPPLRIDGPVLVLHLACLRDPGDPGVSTDLKFIADLARHHGAPAPGPASRYGILPRGETQVKWELHTEFTSYTLVMPRPDIAPGAPAWTALPEDALKLAAQCPGQCVVAFILEIRGAGGPVETGQLFPSGDVVASSVGDGAADVWTDFRLDSAGFGRMLMVNRGLTGGRAGRMVQRLLEIETYRLMALLGLMLTRAQGGALAGLEGRLRQLIERTAAPGEAGIPAPGSEDGDRRLLNELTRLAAEAASLGTATRYRLSASAAYAELVARRLEDIREGRVDGLSRLSSFLERRFTPAMRTCEAFGRRLDQLEIGIDRASDMLRTRVDVNLQAQNSALLKDMESRSRVQLRIQEAVEGLSVFAISYYLIGLLKVVTEGLFPGDHGHAHKVLAAIAVPIVLGAVWLGVKRLRRALKGSGG